MTPLAAPHSVEVWRAALQDITNAERDFPLLSENERARAARFHFERDRHRFIAAHGFLRRQLARHLGAEPGSIVFGAGLRGKPFVAAPETTLQFNLSHSGDYALLAVTGGPAVGVDIERITDIEHDLIAAHFFSALEREQLRGLSGDEKATAFAACWTRKEAYLKATGVGVTGGLDHFDVSLLPGVPAALIADRRGPDAARWRMANLDAPAGYAAALAVEGHDWELECLTFS